MKKILFVVNNLGMGGIQRVVTVISESLANDYDVKIYSHEKVEPFYEVEGKVVFGKQNIFEKYLKPVYLGINVLYRLVFRKKKTLINTNINSLCRYLEKNPVDTVIISGPSVVKSSIIKKRFPNINVILWMHNNHKVYFEGYFSKVKDSLIESIKYADTTVALTDEDKKGYGAISENVIKINNPITLDSLGLVSDLKEKIISITCRYDIQHKGLDYLVKIAKKLPNDWKIAIAGSGNNQEVEALKKIISDEKVEDKIILRGALEGEELLNHYNNSSIYIMTSRWEGMPLVLAEAMSFGLPIIAFEQSGSSEVLENGRYGILVKNGDTQAMSTELLKLIENPELRKNYQEKSLERVQNFRVEILQKQWQDII
jgi:glycosyltransferase involved in cell wall biosynthesis